MDFIDTHNHILPGLDDGPPDLATSIEMARIAAADGVSIIVATPHIVEGLFEGKDLDQRVAALQRELDRQGVDVKLVRGAEVPMSLCLSGDKRLLGQLSIGGKYILMESAETNFEQVSRAVYQVRLNGLYPVLAHPERTSFAGRELDRLQQLVERDNVFCQVSAASMEGIFGAAVEKTCTRMARRGLVHLLASDAHSTGKRSPRLSGCYMKLSRIAGKRAACVAVHDNPAALIGGDKLLSPNLPSRPAGPLSRIFRRA